MSYWRWVFGVATGFLLLDRGGLARREARLWTSGPAPSQGLIVSSPGTIPRANG